MCTRSGSTVRLKANSHPTGGRGSVVTTADGTFKVGFGESSARSPLCVRSTEMVGCRRVKTSDACRQAKLWNLRKVSALVVA